MPCGFLHNLALLLPVITMEKDQFGLALHTHGETCYEKVLTESITSLSCTDETLGVHVHGMECSDAAGNLLCSMADFLIHTHAADPADRPAAAQT